MKPRGSFCAIGTRKLKELSTHWLSCRKGLTRTEFVAMCAMIQQFTDVADTLDRDNPFAAVIWELTASAGQRDILPEFLHPSAGHGDLIPKVIIAEPDYMKNGLFITSLSRFLTVKVSGISNRQITSLD